MTNWTEIDDAMVDNITDEVFAKYYETATLTVSQKRELINKAEAATNVIINGSVDPELWRSGYHAMLDVVVEAKAESIYEEECGL
jgi:hypothetical protein